MIARAEASARTVDWVAREGSDFRAEAILAGSDIGGLVDVLDRSIPATWVGSGAAAFGLTGSAQKSDIKNLVRDGFLPDGTRVRSPQVKNTTFNMIIAAPKTISMLLAHPDSRVRDAVDAAMRAGAAAAIGVFEKSARSRIGTAAKGNLISVATPEIIAAVWQHRSSSTGDPHAHAHVMISATAPCADGKWRAIDATILLDVKREAEAAAQITIEKSISAALGLADTDFSEILESGSVRYQEISSLRKFIEKMSGARQHVKAILEKSDKILGKTTNAEDLAAWREHRQTKEILAEKVEHEIDAALAAGDDAAAAIRGMWDNCCNNKLFNALKKFKISENPATPRPHTTALLTVLNQHEDFAKQVDILSKSKKSIIEKLRQGTAESSEISARIASERKSIQRFLPIAAGRREIRLRDDARRLAAVTRESAGLRTQLAEINGKITNLQKNHYLWQDLEKKCLGYLDGLHGWKFSDLSAMLIGEIGSDVQDARIIAARLLDRWAEKSLIKSPVPEKITPLIKAIMAGEEMPPERLYSVMGTKAKFVTTAALAAEYDFGEKIATLTKIQRQRLKIDGAGLDPDQARAAEKIALGKKFLPISGVAGGGKSFLMERVADAARDAGLPVFATARNRKRATETGDDIGARGDAVFSIAAIEKHLTPEKRRRGGLLVIDESALIDREDWEKIVAILEDSNLQAVAIGDRLQAQSIDKKGIWHIAHQAAGEHSATIFKSRRCRKWHSEHDDLRNGDKNFLPIAEKEGRIVPKIPEAAPGWIAEKILSEPGTIAVTATNEEAAELSAAVQRKMEIDGQIDCRYGCKIGIGDKIRTRKNDRNLCVVNGNEFLVEKIHDDGSILAKSTKNPTKSVTLPPAYLAESAELAYTSTVDSAQGITVRRAIVCVTGAMGKSKVYSAATRGTEPPIYVMTGTASPAEAVDVLTATLARDDIAPTLREIGERADAERMAAKMAAEAEERKRAFAERLKMAREAEAERRARVNARPPPAFTRADHDHDHDRGRGMGMRPH